MNYSKVQIETSDHALEGAICIPDVPKGGIIFVPGGGLESLLDDFREWQEHLYGKGYASLSFDFPGVGGSGGALGETSLNSRLHSLEDALAYFRDKTELSEIIICGRSMGGPLALRTAMARHLKRVILLFPAAFPADAYNKNFGPAFTAELRKENGWVNSPDFKKAEDFEGRILTVYGDQDNVIPKGIQDRYLSIVKQKGVAILLPGVGHNKHIWGADPENTRRRYELLAIIDKFIESESF